MKTLVALCAAFAASAALANSDPLTGVAAPGGAGIGAFTSVERSPYRGAGQRFDVFLRHRFEGFPYDRIPDSIAGMAKREAGLDAGASAQLGGAWGIAF